LRVQRNHIGGFFSFGMKQLVSDAAAKSQILDPAPRCRSVHPAPS